MKLVSKIALCLILILSFYLRIYQLDANPPSISWDEAAAGYNGYSIANFGIDEWGQKYPLVFTSFLDDKHPVWIYFTALSTKILGLSDFATRFPSAVFGVLNVLMLFFVARRLFKNDLAGVLAALFLAISPWNLQFSRGEWEANYALFFFMLGLWSFLSAIEMPKRGWLIIVAFFSFGIDLFTYHSAKVVVPPILILLFILNFKKILVLREYFYIGIAVFGFFILLLVTNPRILGLARAQQAGISHDEVIKSQTYEQTKNYWLSYASIVKDNYLTHFSLDFLFVSGDKNPRQSDQGTGEFYKVDAIFLILGLLTLAWLIYKEKKKFIAPILILLAWILVAPLPAALTQEVPHAHRALFMMGSMHILAALGLAHWIGQIKVRYVQVGILAAVLIVSGFSLKDYLKFYYSVYPQKYAIEWQYGMKQIVDYVMANPQYDRIYMTDERHQPYIFFLYYMKYPTPKFLDTVVYNQGESRSYNLVTSFDKYHFGDWDQINSSPTPGVLYIVTPSIYDGLRYKAAFKLKDEIKYPNGDPAFYLVSVN